MTRTLTRLSAALALSAITLGATVPAQAHDRGYHDGWYNHDRDDDYGDGYERDGRYGGYDRYRPYQERVVRYRYEQPRQVYYGDRYRCRSDGAAGTIIGAIAGGLIGNSVAGRHGDRTAGTIIGGAVGAVAGRAIDKSDDRCR